MKKSTVKRNAVIVTVVLFVCVAVYLNWSFGKNADIAEETGAQVDDYGLYYEDEATQVSAADAAEVSEYFSKVRLEREQARDSAVETLSVVTGTQGASQETVDEALGQMTSIAQWTTQEAELETLICSKGFDDCVVFISDGGIKVTVSSPAEGLSAAAVARITDVVTTETSFAAEELKIIEVK